MSNPTTKEEAAYQAIRSAIIDGELKPGQSVTIRDLASRFDLGRTPITDAMKHLALDGWLETTTGVGTRVANLTDSPICRYVVQSKLWRFVSVPKMSHRRIFWRWITVWLLLNWLLTPAISFEPSKQTSISTVSVPNAAKTASFINFMTAC